MLQQNRQINPKAHPHYARWVSFWMKASGERSSDATLEYSERLGRRSGFQAWQFRQAVRAVELWCRKVERFEWADQFDWDGLADQSDELESDHRTLLRETNPVRSVQSGNDVPGAASNPAEGEAEAIDDVIVECRRAIRLADRAVATEKTYLYWITRFCRFRLRRLGHPGLRDLEPAHLDAYLEYLALERQVAPATQKQALNALVFLARNVHGIEELKLNFQRATEGKGQLISNNVSSYKIPGPGDIPLDWDIELLNYDPNQSSLHNSKGIGESNVQLGLSVYFAAKEAVRASRLEHGLSAEFAMDFPASVDRVSAVLPDIESLV